MSSVAGREMERGKGRLAWERNTRNKTNLLLNF